jgi:hypothetical protein
VIFIFKNSNHLLYPFNFFLHTLFFLYVGLLCKECEKPIVAGKCVQFGDFKYHVEHFKCSYCKKNLAGNKVRFKRRGVGSDG